MKRNAPDSTPEASQAAKRAKALAIMRHIINDTLPPGQAYPQLHSHIKAAQTGKASSVVRNVLASSGDKALLALAQRYPTATTTNNQHTLQFEVTLPTTCLLEPTSVPQTTPSGSTCLLVLGGIEHLRFGFCCPKLIWTQPVTGSYQVTFRLHDSPPAERVLTLELGGERTVVCLPTPFQTGHGDGFVSSSAVRDGCFRLQVTVVRCPTNADVMAACKPLLQQLLVAAQEGICWKKRELLDHLHEQLKMSLGPLVQRVQISQARDQWLQRHGRLFARMPPDQVPRTPGHVLDSQDTNVPSIGMQSRIRKMLDRGLHPNTPEGEAQRCMRLAQELMDKHQLQQADLGRHQQELTGGMVEVTVGAGLPSYQPMEPAQVQQWMTRLAGVCSSTFTPDRKGKYFHRIRNGRCPTFTFYGFREAAQLAAYAFVAAVQRIVSMKASFVPDGSAWANSGCKSRGAFVRTAKLTYCNGIVARLRQDLPPAEGTAEGTAVPSASTAASTHAESAGTSSSLALVVSHHETVGQQVLAEHGIKLHASRRRKAYASFDSRSYQQGKTDGGNIDLRQRALTEHSRNSSPPGHEHESHE